MDTFAEDALYEEIQGGRKAWRGERAELND